MFGSPFAYCPVANDCVLLDQTLRECAREHGCRESRCPLQGLFVKRCPLRNVHVALDQTQQECARKHGCGRLRCPLAKSFSHKHSRDAEAR